MPLPTNHFYMHLEQLPNFEESLIVFGLHADISIYNKMVEDAEEESDLEDCRIKAIEIFEDYIVEDCQYRVDINQEQGRMSSVIDNELLRDSVTQDMSIRSDTRDMFNPKGASPKNT